MEKLQCQPCKGTGKKWVTDRVVQGQDYGPEIEGHYEQCPHCHGTGYVMHLSQSDIGKAHHFFHFT